MIMKETSTSVRFIRNELEYREKSPSISERENKNNSNKQ